MTTNHQVQTNFSISMTSIKKIFLTFAAVNTKTKRHIAAWMLLTLFVPMLVFSSFHVHGYDNSLVDECSECVQHHCHGHLGQQTVSLHECVLCQFLSLPMVAVAVVTLIIYNKVSEIFFTKLQSAVHSDACGIITLRAPPAV